MRRQYPPLLAKPVGQVPNRGMAYRLLLELAKQKLPLRA
jgi:hypothetical protein